MYVVMSIATRKTNVWEGVSPSLHDSESQQGQLSLLFEALPILMRAIPEKHAARATSRYIIDVRTQAVYIVYVHRHEPVQVHAWYPNLTTHQYQSPPLLRSAKNNMTCKLPDSIIHVSCL